MSEKQPKKPIKIRVNIAGYGGSGESLFAAYDPDTEVLFVAKSVPYEAGDRPGFLKITNQSRDGSFDALFTEDDLQAAIRAYFDLDALKVLNLAPEARRHDPKTSIEQDGVAEGGAKYRIKHDISNGKVAVMVACLYANRQRDIEAARGMVASFDLLTV